MTTKEDIKGAIKNYWEDPNTVSIIDKNLHQLEIEFAASYLKPTDHMADIGCGNGDATIEYSKHVCSCIGLERSQHLISLAKEKCANLKFNNLSFASGDILDLDKFRDCFDSIVTQRTLINLSSWNDQKNAILNIHAALKPNGRYIMVENTQDSFQNLNDMRASVGLNPIKQHWHNLFLDFETVTDFLKTKFKILKSFNLSLYYFLTRVYTPMYADFTGFGIHAKKDALFERSDAAARLLAEKFGDLIEFKGHRALGNTQGFVLEKLAI